MHGIFEKKHHATNFEPELNGNGAVLLVMEKLSLQVKLQSTSKMLHKRDGPGLRLLYTRTLGRLDVMVLNIFDDDPVHLRRQLAIGGAPEPERHGKREIRQSV